MSSLKLKHSSGNGTIINAPAANPSADITLKVPSTTGSSGHYLKIASANHSSTNAELEWGAVTTQSANAVAKVWINFNGTGTIAIRGSYGVSSITDNGTGDYTVSFSSAFADTNYCFVNGNNAYTLGNTDTRFPTMVSAVATGSISLTSREIANGGGITDTAYVCLAIFDS